MEETPEGFVRWPRNARPFSVTITASGVIHLSGSTLALWQRPLACHIYVKWQKGKKPVVMQLVPCAPDDEEAHLIHYKRPDSDNPHGQISVRSLAREMGIIESGTKRQGEAYLVDNRTLFVEFGKKQATRTTRDEPTPEGVTDKGGWANPTEAEMGLRKQRSQQEQQRGGLDD
ncbi:hypothetical protein LCGC14_2392920 [marine sediment metagenome]|uniref:Uncharacterized protein n=1 Tax=marine sediment metagenome TaxID=412755 RepID=A0A0F9BXM6_9ZZZZ